METNTLRSLIKTAATGTPGARLWPNGLGFDCRGTQYSYSVRTGTWLATRTGTDCTGYRSGEGATPEAAKRAAGIGRAR